MVTHTKNPLSALALSLCLSAVTVSQSFAADNDVQIYANGEILTMNPKQPTATAMAILDGKILALDKFTHPMSPSAGECDYIVSGIFTYPRPIADIKAGVRISSLRVLQLWATTTSAKYS